MVQVQSPTHPKGTQARVLLTGVFGPYAQDDDYGSRAINPMELYHNQVTRAQGSYSLRMFHRSWGILLIQHNISAPCALLDFPTLPRFEQELRDNEYDIVGISSIIANVGKVREMCKRIRSIQPKATIVVGGHVASIPGLQQMVDADHVVKGEGIRWMREYLGEDPNRPIVHPALLSAFDMRVMGMKMEEKGDDTAATIIPSVGCPMGCNFCTTSAFFGGKGKWTEFFHTGDEIFQQMLNAERELGVRSFFIMDENFLLNRPRALQLLELMKKNNKAWVLYVFSSMNAIRKYTIDELVQLGVSWIWMGLESPKSGYEKLKDADTLRITEALRQNGIKLLGSTIVGLEHHTPENIRAEIDYAVSHRTDFHQFMLYTPIPGTPLHAQMTAEGRMLEGIDLADIHGQFKFNFNQGAISRDQSKEFLDWAFQHDFEQNGPSIFRICETTFSGWLRHKNHPDPRVRARFAWETKSLRSTYSAALWAMEKRFTPVNAAVAGKIRRLRCQIRDEFGLSSMLWAHVAGPLLLWTSKREDKRLAHGVTYEPRTFFVRRNWAS
ncbi:MAG: B12-binding domain-containing radical SAM protein [Acidobacteria bacterium]|nr:MAG: B12-binding domain-containing radical SAM protein [Acidobacteriota bacterium]